LDKFFLYRFFMLKKLFTPFEYVNKQTFYGLVAFQTIVLLLVWAFGMPEKSFFPHLGDVIKAWGNMWNEGLMVHILRTLKLCFVATLISILFSGLVAYLSVIPFFKPIALFFTKLRYNPIVGFTLFLTIATGGGRKLQIILLVIFMSFYFITSLMSAISTIPEEDLYRRKAQKMSRWQILWKVVIMDRLDYLVEIIRQNLSITFMMIVSVEIMSKENGGIGAMLKDLERNLDFAKIFALQITILIIGIILDMLLGYAVAQFPSNRKTKTKPN
jgi:ABC-type nitrate/sulfonate/bicarbonate transport system permease component